MAEASPTDAKPSNEPEASETSEASVTSAVTAPLARDLYDWASRFTSEAGDGLKDYYWTPQVERLVAKLKLTKRALVGVVGVQGAGKSAAMRAIEDRLIEACYPHMKNEFSESTVAVKVPESGGLRGTLKDAFGEALAKRLDDSLDAEVLDRVQKDSAFYQRAIQHAKHMGRSDLEEKLHLLDPESGFSVDTTNLYLSPTLRNLVSKRRLRELEERALDRLLSEQRVIMIDMPDYPKHDRRLIARDLDDIQGLWNRLMVSKKDVSLVVFIQKETFNHAEHFLYGKMDLIDLLPLTGSQLLEAYARKWRGYAPFTEDALQYIAKMSRGIFRRFKRYIGLALEMWMMQGAQPEAQADLEFVKKAVTDEEVMRDMDKELDGIFRKPEQKQKAFELINQLAKSKAYGVNPNDASQVVEHAMKQEQVSKLLDISEMAASRLLRELEQHGYVKRFTRPRQMFGGEEKIVQLNW